MQTTNKCQQIIYIHSKENWTSHDIIMCHHKVTSTLADKKGCKLSGA